MFLLSALGGWWCFSCLLWVAGGVSLVCFGWLGGGGVLFDSPKLDSVFLASFGWMGGFHSQTLNLCEQDNGKMHQTPTYQRHRL